MKRKILKPFWTLLLLILFGLNAMGQPPPPGHGENDDQPAPIGSGLVILGLLAAAYGAKCLYDARRSS